MSDSDASQTARRRIEDLLDTIDDQEGWSVQGYDPTIDPYQDTAVELTAVYTPPKTQEDERPVDKNSLKAIIAGLENDDRGAKIEEILAAAHEQLGWDNANTKHNLEKLKQTGDVYESATEVYRTA